ncbi:MAG: phosphoribosylanthranilate isomerase [Halobacteriota archaeon]
MRTKICGLTTEREVRQAVGAGADAVGFLVRVPVDSHREISVERAHELARATPPFVTTVAVTMPASPEEAGAVAVDTGVDAVQIHEAGFEGGEELRRRGIKLIKKARPGETLPDEADAYVVDTEGERGAGGTGETHDWSETRAFVERVDRPVVLAGGLTPDNVAEAVREVRPFAVDVSSGVERDGSKDDELVRCFVERAREAGR